MRPGLAAGGLALALTQFSGSAAAADCAADAAALGRDQADLPRLEFTTPADRPPYCITLETLIAFAVRVKAHVAACRDSEFVQQAAEWEKSRVTYSQLFSRYRCRRTL
jgi:hypothetical protein